MSRVLFPVQTTEGGEPSTPVGDATTTSKGVIQLAGDLAGTATSPMVPGLTGKANTVHTHTTSDITSGTFDLARLPVATSGTISTTQLVRADDTRLSNARTPVAHTHAIADVTNLQTTLDGKAATNHTQAASTITDFAEAVDDRVAVLITAGTGISKVYDDTNGTLTLTATGGSTGGTPITVQDEGTTLTTGASSFNFTGTGVTATASGGAVTVNVASGGAVDATNSVKGVIQLANDLGGTASAPTVATNTTAKWNANRLQGNDISTTNPTSGQLLVYTTGTPNLWTPTDIGSVPGIFETIDDRVSSLIVAGTGITKTYDDANNTLTLSAESTTASNVGVGGFGLYRQKAGTNFEFRNINVASNKLSVALDATNNEVDLDVVEANLSLLNISGTLTLAKGGTGATTAAAARTNLGLGSAALLSETTATWNANQLQGRSVNSVAPTDGQVLIYNGATTDWRPGTISGGGGGSSVIGYVTTHRAYTTTSYTDVRNPVTTTPISYDVITLTISPNSIDSYFVIRSRLGGWYMNQCTNANPNENNNYYVLLIGTNNISDRSIESTFNTTPKNTLFVPQNVSYPVPLFFYPNSTAQFTITLRVQYVPLQNGLTTTRFAAQQNGSPSWIFVQEYDVSP